MPTSHVTALGYALLTAGMILGTVGTLASSDPMWHGGLVLILTSLPIIGVRAIQRMHHVADDERTREFNAGYLLGLDHAARGLLDHTAPPNGHRAGYVDQTHRNVVPLRPIQHTERQAQ